MANERPDVSSYDLAVEGFETLENTCIGCPVQYEGILDGKWFYLRYRYSDLAMELWEEPHFGGQCLFRRDLRGVGADQYDGTLEPHEIHFFITQFVNAWRGREEA